MKKRTWMLIVGSVLAIAVATPGFAQMKEFVGASVYGSTGYNTWSTEFSGTKDTTYTYSLDTATSAGLPLFVGVDYTWAVSDVNSLGLSFERNFLKSASGSSNTYSGGTYLGGSSTVVDDSYQISVVPGFLIDKNSLAYGKFGYYSAGLTSSTTYASNSFTQTGYSLGAGVKTLFNIPSSGNNFYVFGESNYRIANSVGQTFSSGGTSDIKLGGMNVLVGLGMHF